MTSNPNARLETFCDGVFAIALTLLIIDVRIPATTAIVSSADLWRALGHLLPSVFAFALSFGIIVLFAIVAYRWLKKRLLWRLRNRLIVTYVFIGVIPTALLAAMALITIYLFAGQFANFVVISELNSRLRS